MVEVTCNSGLLLVPAGRVCSGSGMISGLGDVEVGSEIDKVVIGGFLLGFLRL